MTERSAGAVQTASGQARLLDPTGLHARPAVKLTKLAKGYGATVEVKAGTAGPWVNAKSPNAVMKLMAAHGETLFFRASGADADRAVAELVDLVERDFDGDSNGERVLSGVVASGGLAFGTLTVDRATKPGPGARRPSEDEVRALREALAGATEDLDRLIAGEDRLAAEVLDYQRALLGDPELIDPIVASVRAGERADTAWANAMDREIAAYRATGDTTFRARADDLLDLKDRVGRGLGGGAGPVPRLADGDIYVAETLTPSRFLELDWTKCRGAVVCDGSPTSHVAILARARGIPLVVGVGKDVLAIATGTPVVLDAEAGRIVVKPSSSTMHAMNARAGRLAADDRAAADVAPRPAATLGGEAVRVLVNIDDPAMLATLRADLCDGVGLTRTEFLFRGASLPDEEAQLAVYRRVLTWAEGRPVTIRTLDAGGDKPIAGLTSGDETNPFLGVRGLRLSLARPEVFRVQLRALARAAALGPLKVMLPMVTTPAEFDAARRRLDEAVAELARAGVEHGRPALGMMVEVPAAALAAPSFDADFYSIGSNDLIQYTTATARDNPRVAGLADPRNPAVLELIRRTVQAGRDRGVEVSLCGDMASDPDLVPLLIECGLRALSVAPARIGHVKLAIGRHG